jgi:quercetin dioxygenase-like cupin family protein
MKYKRSLLMLFLGTICFVFNVQAKDLSRNVVVVKKLYNGNQNAIGQLLTYPQGDLELTSELIVVPPAKETGWHMHAVPMFGYILAGEITVDYGNKGRHVYKEGEAIIEAVNWAHNGKNTGKEDARILVLYMGVKGVANETLISKSK